jgi:hypothetical protein
MRIESGTTRERRVRSGLFVLMLLGFAGWFAYDGYVSYPAKNLKWATTAMRGKVDEARLDEVRTNPKVTVANLKQLDETVKAGDKLSVEELKNVFGEPAVIQDNVYWYVGPAAFAAVGVEGDQVRAVQAAVQQDPSESSIQVQKVLAYLLLGGAVLAGLQFIRVLRTHAVLDDSGLTFNRRHVSWDAMRELDTKDLPRKGWLDLIYEANGSTRRLRIDSYHVQEFDTIISTICERKGWPCPVRASTQEGSENPDASASV